MPQDRKKHKRSTGHRPVRSEGRHRPADAGRLLTPSGLDVRTLIVLSLGDFCHLDAYEEPPAAVQKWLDQADLSQLRGMLIGVLQRWQQLN